SEQLGSGSVSGALSGLDPAQAKQAATAGAESFVYALGHAMSVSALVALVGAVVGVTAIRAKGKRASTLESAEASVNPGGSAVTAVEESEAAPTPVA
ncbi:MAG TPA: hypothetical protein VHM66_11800, partial [Solirubrobacterales bacterium]|nr:hypothetical protein [Solirubrobacterales bacterium]